MLKLRAPENGDTIIEVVLAFAVFSMISVGAMTVMGQGTNASQRALEITLVRQQIDAQAEAIRAAHQAYTSSPSVADNEWRKIARSGAGNNSTVYADETTCPTSAAQLARSFIMDPRNATMYSSDNKADWYQDINTRTSRPYAQVETPNVRGFGMWVERAFNQGVGVADSYDFKVRACWYGAGLDVPLQIETVVRLYEPGV